MSLSDIVFFHKKHHTVLILIETGILAVVSFFMAMLVKVEEWTVIGSLQQMTDSYYCLAFGSFSNFIPFILMLLELLIIILIVIFKNVMWKPIIAKKTAHVLFYISLAIIVVDLFITILIPAEVYNTGISITSVSNVVGKLISTVMQLIVAFNIYCWREEFGLEKIYG